MRMSNLTLAKRKFMCKNGQNLFCAAHVHFTVQEIHCCYVWGLKFNHNFFHKSTIVSHSEQVLSCLYLHKSFLCFSLQTVPFNEVTQPKILAQFLFPELSYIQIISIPWRLKLLTFSTILLLLLQVKLLFSSLPFQTLPKLKIQLFVFEWQECCGGLACQHFRDSNKQLTRCRNGDG
jgi:hypothetical protein